MISDNRQQFVIELSADGFEPDALAVELKEDKNIIIVSAHKGNDRGQTVNQFRRQYQVNIIKNT